MGNLRKAWVKWDQLLMILGSEGANVWVLGMFFNAVVQAVLLFSPYMWVMTTHMDRSLEVFHHRMVIKIAGE